MTTYYHGSHNLNDMMHNGICLTEDESVAAQYAGSDGHILVIELDESSLDVLDCEAYDHDENTAPGDDGDSRGADALLYEDETETGRVHDTLRLMSDRALSQAKIVEVITEDE